MANMKNVVTIEAGRPGEVISPLLFGHNLEVTRRGFWSGLSAEMVANRKFAAVEGDLPKRWQPLGEPGGVRTDTEVAYAGGRGLRIDVPPQGPPAGVAQRQEVLAVSKGRRYQVRLWLRTQGPRQVRVRLAGDEGQTQFDTRFPCRAGEWQLLSGEFTASATRTDCLLEITSGDPGTYWLGAVSVLPADAFHGMRRDVIERLKAIKPGCLRFPGGCYAEFYSWQDGLLPADRRPTIQNTGLDFLFRNSDDVDTQECGIDEFAALCREVGAEPAITVRLTDNSPDDAAALVEYCNGGPETKWGRVRADRGHREPYGVRWWFLGNEIYLFRRGNVGTPDGCAAQTRLFAEAMRKADPRARLVACTAIVNGNVDAGWNTPLLESAGSLVQAASAHEYILDQVPLNTAADLASLLKAPTRMTLAMLRRGRDFLDQHSPAGTKIGLTYDEWNTRWGLPGSVPMGLLAAAMLNMLCREARSLGLDLACYFMPVTEGAIRVGPLSAELDTAGHVFELYRPHQGNRLLAVSGADRLDCCASMSPDGAQIRVTAVNDVAAEQPVTFRIAGAAAGGAADVECLVPRTLELTETAFDHTNQRPIFADGGIDVILPPGAIARITVNLTNKSPAGRE